MVDVSIQPLITELLRRLTSYALFGLAGYHGVRGVVAAVCSNGESAREHGCTALVFVVAGLIV